MNYKHYSGGLVPQIVRHLRHIAIQHGGRFIRFGLVGAAGVLINTVLLYLGSEVVHLPAFVAAGIATELTIIVNFVVNDRWTFRDMRNQRPALHRIGAYNGIALGGMFISLVALAALTHFLGVHYLIANLFGIGVAMLWNYIVNAQVTWDKPVPYPS